MNKLVFSSFCGFLLVGTLHAQEFSHFSFELGGGFTEPVGNTAKYVDNYGWNLQGGVGYNFSPYIGVMGELGYNSLGINSATLGNTGYSGGGIDIFSATVDPIVHLIPKSHIDVYAIGGGGLYHVYENFSAASGAVINPFAGGSFQLIEPTNSNLSYSENKPGFNAGMGVAIGTKWHGKLFAEARYVHVFTNNNMRADYVPVTFGFRW
jgi:hypothetical protein